MPITNVTSREFNQDVSRAKKAAKDGPVIITDRGKPAHVLLSIEAYRELTKDRRNLVEALAVPGLSEIDFQPMQARIGLRDAGLD